MNAPIQAALRWLLVLVALCASSFAAFILAMGLTLWPDRSIVATLSAFGFAPHSIIELTHRLDFFLTLLIWVLPPTCAIGFAARTNQRRALRLALSISIVLMATLCFFLGRQDHSVFVESVALVAAIIVLAALILSFLTSNLARLVTFANLVAILLLFLPSTVALARRNNVPPQAKELWSAVLQQDVWQAMNTGSEYAATRQVVFAGNRVVAVFDAGDAAYQGKQPMSNFRIVSIDAKTGAKKNEIIFSGRWGFMPYLYATHNGLIDVQSNPPRTLNPDLTTATNASAGTEHAVNGERVPSSAFPGQATMPNGSVLDIEKNHFRVLDSNGRLVSQGNLIEYGTYAGASSDGRRFVIESNYSEGDPDFVVYEYFTIYDIGSAKPVATIHMKDLPERQSWSAFSPDGRYFVAGSPNKLTMYQLP